MARTKFSDFDGMEDVKNLSSDLMIRVDRIRWALRAAFKKSESVESALKFSDLQSLTAGVIGIVRADSPCRGSPDHRNHGETDFDELVYALRLEKIEPVQETLNRASIVQLFQLELIGGEPVRDLITRPRLPLYQVPELYRTLDRWRDIAREHEEKFPGPTVEIPPSKPTSITSWKERNPAFFAAMQASIEKEDEGPPF